MTLHKSNGDPLQGTISVPTWYPDPTSQNVNMVAMDQAYHGLRTDPSETSLPPYNVPVPTGLASATITATTFTLSWTAPTDPEEAIVSYDIFRGNTNVGTVTTTSVSITGLTTATLYSFTVVARTAHGALSAKSAPLAVTTS